jgi:hypothetical protein
MTATLTVHEDGRPLAYGFDDLVAYHGFGYPGGVAHALKVMEAAFPLLAGGAPPERREIAIRTAFRGPGARDAFEMVTRAVTGERYVVDHALEMPERGETLERYVFVFSYRGTLAKLRIREGLVRDDFVALGRKTGRTPEEERELTRLKADMAERLVALPGAAVYETA